MKKKLCVIYITTGKYNIFYSDFYKSFNLNFCNDDYVTFFVFTDDPIYIQKESFNNNVKIFPIESSGNTDFLKFRKFRIMSQAEELYNQFDYVFYMNGNLICRTKVSLDELFQGKPQYAVPHSLWNLKTNPMYDQLCKFPKSASYFDARNTPTYKYVQSGNFGCTSERFIRMCDFIESGRCYDSFNEYDKYIPWHDETYYNKYINVLLRKEPENVNILDGKMYLCSWLPELQPYRDICKMILRNKNYCWYKNNQPLNPR